MRNFKNQMLILLLSMFCMFTFLYAADNRVDGYPDGTGIQHQGPMNSSTAIWNDVYVNGPQGGGILVYTMNNGEGGAGTSYIFSNGLDEDGDTVLLGGELIQDTDIDLNGKKFIMADGDNALRLNCDDDGPLPISFYGFTSIDSTTGMSILSGIAEMEDEDFPGVYFPAKVLLQGDPLMTEPGLAMIDEFGGKIEDGDTIYMQSKTIIHYDGENTYMANVEMNSEGKVSIYGTGGVQMSDELSSLSLNSDGSLNLNSDGSLSLNSDGSSINLNSDGSLSLNSDGSSINLNSDGSSINLNSDGSLSLNSDGSSINLNSDGSLRLNDNSTGFLTMHNTGLVEFGQSNSSILMSNTGAHFVAPSLGFFSSVSSAPQQTTSISPASLTPSNDYEQAVKDILSALIAYGLLRED